MYSINQKNPKILSPLGRNPTATLLLFSGQYYHQTRPLYPYLKGMQYDLVNTILLRVAGYDFHIIFDRISLYFGDFHPNPIGFTRSLVKSFF